eukprot:NODE_30706_length_412_cov_0.810526.p1 GENE.NODE_30706_length_412_cov_0.810526~~NODE_30706_length_412_cov_0.810526.p1  ORF type:complete len:74 (-),score=11.39 NODE_30706_length_412_cov_0.810526:152-373(-)
MDNHGRLDQRGRLCNFFFFKQKTAYENKYGLVGSEMGKRDRGQAGTKPCVLVSLCLKKKKKKKKKRNLGWDGA